MFDTLYRFCYNQYIETFAKCLILVSLFVQTPVNQSKIEANSDTIGVVKSALEQAPVKEFPDFKENYRKTVLEAPKPIPVPEPVIQAPPPPAPVMQPVLSPNDAKAFIYMRESGNNPHAINKSSGACGLGQALPCSKMPCALGDYSCQDQFFTQYMLNRYGSWENARAFWNKHHWW